MPSSSTRCAVISDLFLASMTSSSVTLPSLDNEQSEWTPLDRSIIGVRKAV